MAIIATKIDAKPKHKAMLSLVETRAVLSRLTRRMTWRTYAYFLFANSADFQMLRRIMMRRGFAAGVIFFL